VRLLRRKASQQLDDTLRQWLCNRDGEVALDDAAEMEMHRLIAATHGPTPVTKKASHDAILIEIGAGSSFSRNT
jgi:hypothetical protein